MLSGCDEELSRELKSFVKAVCDKRIYAALVVGLGNRNVTPDALHQDALTACLSPAI